MNGEEKEYVADGVTIFVSCAVYYSCMMMKIDVAATDPLQQTSFLSDHDCDREGRALASLAITAFTVTTRH